MFNWFSGAHLEKPSGFKEQKKTDMLKSSLGGTNETEWFLPRHLMDFEASWGWYQKNSFPEGIFDDLPTKDPGLGKILSISS